MRVELNTCPDRFTMALYGASRSGKTWHAATWPRPVFLSDAIEAGWDTIAHMPREAFHEPELWPKYPEVRAVRNAQDMISEISVLEQRAQTPGEVGTVVVDTLTSYADAYLARLERGQAEAPAGVRVNKWEIYGSLYQHLRALVMRIHAIPNVHVIWTCHEKAPLEEGDRGGIQLPGKMANALPSLAKLWFYQHVNGTTHEVRTRPWRSWQAGHRFGALLPDPIAPSYRALAAVFASAALVDSAPMVAIAPSPPLPSVTPGTFVMQNCSARSTRSARSGRK